LTVSKQFVEFAIDGLATAFGGEALVSALRFGVILAFE
jgi:hypothetical protein